MFVLDHAIRRYKTRIGSKSASKKRIYNKINRDLKKDVVSERRSKQKNHYIITTSKYQAVCYKRRVITILNLHEDADACKSRDELDI